MLQVEKVIKKHKDQLLLERYRFNMGLLMGKNYIPDRILITSSGTGGNFISVLVRRRGCQSH